MSTAPSRATLRRCLASLAAVTIGLGGVVVSTSVANAAPSSPSVDLSGFVDGRYVVQLVDDSAALYTGGVPNLQRTSPLGTDTLDDTDPAVVAYSDYLETEQEEVAASVGADVEASLTLTLNGFVADLTVDQAIELSLDPRVAAVTPDEVLQIDASPSNEYLDLDTMWGQVGGVEGAGDGVVVGVLDTGIAPENPLFAGDALGTTEGAEPYWSGTPGDEASRILFVKGDGQTFTGTCQTGPGFTAEMCSTKIVGAQFFAEGAIADGFAFGTEDQVPGEYLSPRDGDGHGSHTASTAAGNVDVPVTTEGGQDIGTMSGVAPEARIAAYKVCWSGTDPASTDDDACYGTDLLAGIEAATADGVDVINFSIGGGAADSVASAYDIAFLGAAAAGIFVSASAGNSGPNPTTLDHASPWYSTVANTTIPNYEATVSLSNGFEAAGASITVDMDPDATPLSGPLVYAGDIPAEGAAGDNAALCFPGSIQTVPAGTIVVCDRGTNARAEKSQVVADAGGAGMILVNVVPSSVDLDDHAVPTVHLDAQYRTPLLEAVESGETATFTPGNSTGIQTPAPIVAASSSRGPVEADGNDVIKPDIAAPGTGIIAAGPNAPGEEGSFIFLSGTSMAAPHVAGLAAVYLGANPFATPAEIKSALMTTATDTVDDEGGTTQDWFAQGAGFVNATSFLDAGVYYANGLTDWHGYLRGVGYELPDSWVGAPIDPSDLNIPSIGIGALAGTQTVTRTLTALEAGSYDVSVDAPAGVSAVVSPSTLSFDGPGATGTYTVTFTVEPDATLEAWTQGSLTWTSAEHTARSPIAVYPVIVDAPQWVEGTGSSGQVPVSLTSGITGTIPLDANGLYPVEEFDSGSGATGDQLPSSTFTVAEGETARYFALDSLDPDSDLDLYAVRVVDGQIVEQHVAGTEAASETLLVEDPTPGTWMTIVSVYSSNEATTDYVVRQAAVTQAEGRGSFTTDPTSIQGTTAQAASYTATWEGLPFDGEFIGAVNYSDESRTFVRVTTGSSSPPPPERISGGNRYETAVAASELGYPEGAPVVYVASGANYPDGLSAGPAAAVEGGPLLLTDPASSPDVVIDEIERLAPSRIVIVGGTNAISEAVETELGELAETVDRIAGADRFETSRLIADYAFGDGAGTAFLATGHSFPDALTAGAAGGAIGAPVLLVDGMAPGLDAATAATIDSLGVTRTLVAGGTAAVSDGIVSDLIDDGRSPQRLAGADRFLTGVYINQAIFGPPVSAMYIASGLNFPDALSASALAGADQSPLYVVQTNCVNSEIISENLRLGRPDVYLMGGPAALGDGVASYALCG